jgi:uncharacterized protein (TIGR02118 family)
MTKLVALYRTPADITAFDTHFTDVHLPLLRKFPGLRSLDVLRVTGAPIGESKYHVLIEAGFDTRDAMDVALASREGKAVARDLMAFAPDLVAIFHGETLA